jgi:plastocyanin
LKTFLIALGLLSLAALASAAGPACTPTCDVQVVTGLFAPPVVAADDGASVTWHTLSGIHTTTSDDGCFDAPVATTPTVTFTNVGGVAFADDGSGAHACTGAVALPDGSLAVPYHCRYHAEMHGVVLVKA